MVRFKGLLVAGLLMTGAIVGACGQATPEIAALGISSAGQTTDRAPGRMGDRPGGPQGLPGLMPGVSLTADQKAQVQAITEKYKPTGKAPDNVKALLAAETIDEAALRTALQQAAEGHTKRHQDHLAMLGEIRAIYTDEQRAEIVARLQEQTDRPAPPADMEAKRAEREAALATKLGLNAEQQAALAALKPASDAKPDGAAHRAAMITFWQTGDTSALRALPQPTPPDVEATVKAAILLTVEQRQAVFGRFAMGPGHHGKGGHGGREHGRRGPGGPRPDAPAPESV